MKQSLFFFFSILIALIFPLTKTFASERAIQSSFTSLFEHSLRYTVEYPNATPQVQGLAITTLPTVPIETPKYTTTSLFLAQVNTYRKRFGLPAVQSSDEVCSFASVRAKEIADHFTHEGFNTRTESHTIPYRAWSRATENIAVTIHPAEVVSLWEHSASHAANMRDNTPYVCIERFGNYYAYEGMQL